MSGIGMNRGKSLGRKRNHAGEVTSRVRVTIPRPPPLEQPSQRQVQEVTLPSREEQHSPTTEQTNTSSSTTKNGRGLYRGVEVDKLTKNGGTILIKVSDLMNRCFKKEARLFANHCGLLVRTVVSYREGKGIWSNCVAIRGDELWMRIKEKFRAGDERKEIKLKAVAFETMSNIFRNTKSRCHARYKLYSTDEERLANRPEGISPPDWEWLIQHFGEAEFKKRSETNKQNRGNQITVHTSGSQSFAEVADSMRNPDTGEPAPPDQVWEKQHTRKIKEGEKEWEDPKSKEIYERLHELVVQQSQETENPLNNNQMLESVLGRRSGYVRGLGYGAKLPSSRGMSTLEVEARVESALGTVREQLDEERAKRAEMEKKLQEQYELERARRMKIEQKQSDLEAQVSALMTLFNQGQFQVPLPSNITRSNNEG